MEALPIVIIVIGPFVILATISFLNSWREKKRIREWEALSATPEPSQRVLDQPLTNSGSAIDSTSSSWPDDELYLKRLSKNLFPGHFTLGDVSCCSYSYQNRFVVLEYSHKSNPKILNVNISVTQKFWLRLLRQVGENRPDELSVESPSFDLRFRIDSDQPKIATRFLNYPEIMKEFSKLHPFDRFEIYKGSAIYTIHNPQDNDFLHSEYANTFSHLIRILEIYEGQILDLVISELRSDDSVCPFCRGNLISEQETIVICKLCQTRHHQSCMNENKQCTTWGCSATVQDFVIDS